LQPEEGFAFTGLADLRAVHVGAKDSDGHTDVEEIALGNFPSFCTLRKFYSARAVSVLPFLTGSFHLCSDCSSALWVSGRKVKTPQENLTF